MMDLNEASKLLNNVAPPGERLAYLNPQEEQMLKQMGGSGAEHVAGIPTYNFFQKMIDGIRGKSARKAQEAAQNKAKTQQQADLDRGTRQDFATQLISMGKGGLFDVTDDAKVDTFLNDREGQYLDPFPEYLRDTGDRLISSIEDTARNLDDFAGNPFDRMSNIQPGVDSAIDATRSAQDTASSIYDGRLGDTLGSFNEQSDNLSRKLQNLNTASTNNIFDLQQGVLSEGDAYANALGRSVDTEVDYANRRFDALDQLPGLRVRGESGVNRSTIDEAGNLRRAQESGARGIFDAENSMSDRIQQAERMKALAAGANAESAANAGQRGIRTGMVGQGSGTLDNMANAMIRAQLGAGRSDALADALIADAERRGLSEVDLASSMGDAGTDYARNVGRANVNLSRAMGDAGVEGAEIRGQRYETIGDINPGLADVLEQEARIGNANVALGFGDPRLAAAAENLGMDQSMLDADRELFTSLMNQQLSNTGLLPSLVQQEASLPGVYAEAALAPENALTSAVSPYTATGTLPSSKTAYNSAPYVPATQNEKNILDHMAALPGYVKTGKQIYGGVKDIFN